MKDVITLTVHIDVCKCVTYKIGQRWEHYEANCFDLGLKTVGTTIQEAKESLVQSVESYLYKSKP